MSKNEKLKVEGVFGTCALGFSKKDVLNYIDTLREEITSERTHFEKTREELENKIKKTNQDQEQLVAKLLNYENAMKIVTTENEELKLEKENVKTTIFSKNQEIQQANEKCLQTEQDKEGIIQQLKLIKQKVEAEAIRLKDKETYINAKMHEVLTKQQTIENSMEETLAGAATQASEIVNNAEQTAQEIIERAEDAVKEMLEQAQKTVEEKQILAKGIVSQAEDNAKRVAVTIEPVHTRKEIVHTYTVPVQQENKPNEIIEKLTQDLRGYEEEIQQVTSKILFMLKDISGGVKGLTMPKAQSGQERKNIFTGKYIRK